jgi:Fe-S cluster biogenesis protein NfuA
MDLGLRMHAERTPNPNSIKWVLGRAIVEAADSVCFESQPTLDASPLAHRLFQIDGVIGVFFSDNFATISKRDDIEWEDLAQPIMDTIKQQLNSGEPFVGSGYDARGAAPSDELVARICHLLDEEIRPAVARDGGDIVFVGFRDGVVEVQMRGACLGCASAVATLKQVVESRLRGEIPEVREVVTI